MFLLFGVAQHNTETSDRRKLRLCKSILFSFTRKIMGNND
jgi:hypothetical protein